MWRRNDMPHLKISTTVRHACETILDLPLAEDSHISEFSETSRGGTQVTPRILRNNNSLLL